METDSSPLRVPRDASALDGDDTVVLASDDDDDEDEDEDDSNEIDTAVSVHSVGSSDTEPLNESSAENSNHGSSVDIYESRTPSPPPVDAAATVVADGNSAAMQTDGGNANMPAAAVAENTVTQRILPASDLDNSLSCFKTAKRRKPVVSPPVSSKDDEVDEAEVRI